jgi:hypothetical protein
MNSLFKVKTVVPLLLGIAIAFSPTLRANHDRDDRDRDHHERDNDSPMTLLGVIGIPGNPISSTDIAWVDQPTERLYFTDRGNGPVDTCALTAGAKTHGAVDVVDAENDLFIGRVTTGTMGGKAVCFAGANSVDRNLGGPNGVAAGANLTVWAGDGDDTVKVADVNPKSPTYLQIIASIPLSNLSAASACGATCRRADELGYDPADHIMMVATDAPTTIPPYASFVNAEPPYNVIGQINFAAQGLGVGGGLEQPLWIPALHRFFMTLPTTMPSGFGKIAIVDPRGPNPHVTGVIDLAQFKCNGTGEALGDDDHVLVSCGSFPLVIDLHGAEIGPGVTQVGGGDEVNFNPGDGNFVVASNIDGKSTNPVVLGVIDSESGRWLQNVPLPNGLQPAGDRAGNLAAFGENNHVFVVVHPATPPATDVCAAAGWGTQGCVAVLTHVGEDANEHRGGDRDDHRGDR